MSEFGTGSQAGDFVVPTSGWYQFGDGPPRLLTDDEVAAMGFVPSSAVPSPSAADPLAGFDVTGALTCARCGHSYARYESVPLPFIVMVARCHECEVPDDQEGPGRDSACSADPAEAPSLAGPVRETPQAVPRREPAVSETGVDPTAAAIAAHVLTDVTSGRPAGDPIGYTEIAGLIVAAVRPVIEAEAHNGFLAYEAGKALGAEEVRASLRLLVEKWERQSLSWPGLTGSAECKRHAAELRGLLEERADG